MADLTRKTANLLNIADCNFTINTTLSVTFAKGVITFSGTSGYISSSNAEWKSNFAFYLDAGTYSMNIPTQLGAGYARYIKKYSDDTTLLGASATSFTLAERTQVYFSFYIDSKTLDDTMNFMLVEGSTVQDFEPYGWVHSLRKQCSATETIQSGDTIYANGQPISTYTIKGNTVQNGTPTPSNPIEVQGVGERTENLYNIATVVENTFIKANTTGSPLGSEISNSDWSCSDYIEVSPNTEYTVQYPVYVYAAAAGLVFFTSKSVSSAIEGVTTATQGSKTYTFTTPNNCNYVRFSWGNSKGNETMFVTGGTAKTYEPYGFKIPISSGQQTIDIYIGDLPLLKSLDGTAVDEISNGTLTRRVDSDGSVLPTPTTTQITMPSIPTADGANTITVDTTVQPSEFTATWTGWHDSSVKEWDGSQWQ